MLLNDLYIINEKENTGGGWVYAVELIPSHPVYTGHFPDNPIVPGVCSLQIIKECAEDILGHKVRIAGISSCKFLAIVNPNANKLLNINLRIDKSAESEEYGLSAEGEYEGLSFIKVKATLTKAQI